MTRRRGRSVFTSNSASGSQRWLLQLLLGLAVVLVVGGILVLGVVDVGPQAEEVVREIPQERYLD